MRGIPALAHGLALYLDESRRAWYRQTTGRAIEESADRCAERSRHPLDCWEEEARELLDSLRWRMKHGTGELMEDHR